ncbi:MAG TPA: hypothetical protein VJT67_17180 [Longimicrobiaceae bacterium]|nr:hypothetical protein [Longimicrobiaceae bacterium]
MEPITVYKGYTAKVEFDPDEQKFHGRVEAIRDVVTFQARSVEEVQGMFEEAVDDYLALCALATGIRMGAH